jgi:hypothetical protein
MNELVMTLPSIGLSAQTRPAIGPESGMSRTSVVWAAALPVNESAGMESAVMESAVRMQRLGLLVMRT